MKVSAVKVQPLVAPLRRPIRTGGGAVTEAPLVLIDLVTSDGITGRSYLFSYQRVFLPAVAATVEAAAELLRDSEVVPHEISRRLQSAATLIGSAGLIGMAISGLDVAAWDAVARAAGLPLVTMLGGRPAPIPAYDSLGLYTPDEAAATVAESAAAGFRAVKIKVGFPTPAEDVAVVRAARRAAGDGVAVMVDYNQSLSVAEAVQRSRALDDEGVAWIEEPLRAGDLSGCATVAAAATTPVQIGENFHGVGEMGDAIRVRACDLVMPDVQQIGGVTGWLQAAGLAEAAGLPMSSHIFPDVSAHLLAITPTCHWLEYLDLTAAIAAEPLEVRDGMVTAPDRPGLGLEWDRDAIRRYQ